MRGTFFAAVAAVVFSVGALGQPVVLNQLKIEAVLRQDATVIELPINNSLDRSVAISISLDWLDTKDVVLGSARREIVLAPGRVTVEIPFGLPESTIWLRLRYRLDPQEMIRGYSGDSRVFSRFLKLRVTFSRRKLAISVCQKQEALMLFMLRQFSRRREFPFRASGGRRL